MAFEHFDIGLQAVVLGLEKFANDDMADRMAQSFEFIGQVAQALARPAQRRLRVTPGR